MVVNGYRITGNHAKVGREYHVENADGSVRCTAQSHREAVSAAESLKTGDCDPDPVEDHPLSGNEVRAQVRAEEPVVSTDVETLAEDTSVVEAPEETLETPVETLTEQPDGSFDKPASPVGESPE